MTVINTEDGRLETASVPLVPRVSLSRQSLALLLGRGTGFIISFLIPLVLVRVLDQSVFGEYKQFFLIAVTAVQIAAIGLPSSLFYFLPGGGDRRGRFVSNAIVLLGLIGVVLAVACWAFGPELARRFGADALERVFLLLGVYVALSLVTQFAEHLAIIELKVATGAVVAFLSEAIRGGLIITAVLIEPSVEAIAWASVAYVGVRTVFLVGYSVKLYRGTLFEVRWNVMNEMLRQALPFGIAGMADTALVYLHQYYVAAVTDPAAFAIYAVGCFQIPTFYLLYTALADPALVRATELHKSGDRIGVADLYHDLLRHLGLFFLPSFVFLVAFAPEIIEVLFTDRFLEATPVLMVFGMALLLLYANDHVVLRAYGETRFILFANLAGLAVNAAALVPLYARFGMVGAMLSYVAGLATARTAGVLRISRLLGVPVTRLLPGRSFAMAGGLAVLAGAMSWTAVRPAGLHVRLFGGAALFSAVWLLLAWKLNAIPGNRKDMIRRLWLRRRENNASGSPS